MTRGKGDREERPGTRALGLRMKELTAATGLAKSAILHYVALGLLPEPEKTSKNMAYYQPGCVERVKFIKSLQERYALPLSKIKQLLTLRDEGKDVTPFIELNEAIFGGHEEPTLDHGAFREATGLGSPEIKELREAGLLLPLDDGHFNASDVAVGRVYARAFALGLRASDLAFYAESAKRIVDEEMALRNKLTGRLPEDQDARMTTQLVQGARAVRNYVVDRTFLQRVVSLKGFKEEGPKS